ncbi:hypothetical protein UPYG_G00341560 [Umbra pygmaea]|uniref:EF-hand domain-containing protein n=1 Tax=Umbra pygmaea TaxID=75934 RepID=A0ABD0WIX5_UMBPY
MREKQASYGFFSADVCVIKGGMERIKETRMTGDIPHLLQPHQTSTEIYQFKNFAGNDGSSNTLSKAEFSSLVASQLPTFVKNANDPSVIEQLMKSLDENNDGELTFLEFWKLIGNLANKQGGF